MPSPRCEKAGYRPENVGWEAECPTNHLLGSQENRWKKKASPLFFYLAHESVIAKTNVRSAE